MAGAAWLTRPKPDRWRDWPCSLAWLAAVLLIDAMVSPGGTALIYTGVAARVGRAMSRNGTFPGFLGRLNRRGVPGAGIFFNFCVGVILLLPFPGWQTLMGLISSTLVLSLGFGPIALLAFRSQFPDRPRPFRLPCGRTVAVVSFIHCNFVVYWAGWKTNSTLAILVLVATVLLPFIFHRRKPTGTGMEWRSAIWLFPYFGCIFVCSWLGQYGGRERLPHGVDLLVIALLSLLVMRLAHTFRRSNEGAREAAEDPELLIPTE